MFLYRAEGILNRGNVDAFSLEESQNLSIFFATNNSVTTHLKKQLEEVRVAHAHTVFLLEQVGAYPQKQNICWGTCFLTTGIPDNHMI